METNRVWKQYYIDITPIVESPEGEPFMLGSVRYKISEQMIGELGIGNGSYQLPWSQPQKFAGSYAGIRFNVQVSSADTPQAIPIDQVKADLT